MADTAPHPTATPNNGLGDFFQKHSIESLDDPASDDRLADRRPQNLPPSNGESQAPVQVTPEEPSPVEGQDRQEGEANLELDSATMQALGLDPPAGEAGGEPQAQSEEGTPASVDLDALSSSLGYDKDSFTVRDGKVYVRTKIDGELADKSLADLVKGYQLQEHTTRKSMELAKEREQWEATRYQQEQQLAGQANLANSLLNRELEAINQRYSKVDWDDLRAKDPGQYAALMADYQRETGDVQNRQRELVVEIQKTQQEYLEKTQKEMQEIRQREFSQLTEKMGWTPDTYSENAKGVSQYLLGSAGYRKEEVDQIFDHRFIVMADKARQWDALQKKVVDIRQKKVVSIPKTPAGATTRQGAGPSSRQKFNSAMDRLKKSGSVEDASTAFQHIPGLLE